MLCGQPDTTSMIRIAHTFPWCFSGMGAPGTKLRHRSHLNTAVSYSTVWMLYPTMMYGWLDISGLTDNNRSRITIYHTGTARRGLPKLSLTPQAGLPPAMG